MTLLDTFTRRRVDRDQRWADHEIRESLRWTFREACAGLGLGYQVDGPVAGTAIRTPEVTTVNLGPPVQLVVRCLPGQLPDDFARHGRQLAPHLGGLTLRVESRGLGDWAVLTVVTQDPLAGVLGLHDGRGVMLGRAEDGTDVTVTSAADLPHMIVQGQTRSGKSTFLYAAMIQLLRDPHVLIGGVDPSGITLRPFTGTRHGAWQALGLADLDRIDRVLEALVSEMDGRLAAMPVDRDILPTSAEHPVLVVVLDEYPALLRALDAMKTPKNDPAKRVRLAVARLLAESHKVGFRVVIAAQRAEAQIVGAAERAQCGGRLSFRVDSIDSVKLLHPDGDLLAVQHTSAPPGVALASWPGRPLQRIRAPYAGGYGEFSAAVRAATTDGPDTAAAA